MKTIFGVATAIGRSGIAVIRISGNAALDALKVFGINRPKPRKAELYQLIHKNEIIDQALVLYFPSPNSFTGEDVIEFHIHGSRAVIKNILEILSSLSDFKLAEPGEFSRRAFLNGKMDLAEAEGLADLIDAETKAQAAQAIRQ